MVNMKKITTNAIAILLCVCVGTAFSFSTGIEDVSAVSKPGKVKSLSAKAKSYQSVYLSWSKASRASGYQVVYATNKSFTKNVTTVTVKKNTVKSYTAKGLAKGKTYYVKVRAYKTADGKKIYGAYSTVKNVKVK